MLPEKYRNVDVTQLFPHFKSGKVLRFSKLFGPGKPNSLPQIWRGVKRRKKKRKYEGQCFANSLERTFLPHFPRPQHETQNNGLLLSDSTIDQDKRDVRLDILEKASTDAIEPSEALTLDSNQDKEKDKKDRKDDEDKSSGDNGQPVAADFRFGPAQLWCVSKMLSANEFVSLISEQTFVFACPETARIQMS